MKDTLTSIVAAIKILRNENKNSQAIVVLEDAVKTLCKHHVMDMSSMADVIGFDAVEKELKNGLKLLNIVAEDSKSKKKK
jgi:hypothetical protein